jgi:hypothetical protein
MRNDRAEKRIKQMESYLAQNPEPGAKEYAFGFMVGALMPFVDEREFDGAWSRCLAMMAGGLTFESPLATEKGEN